MREFIEFMRTWTEPVDAFDRWIAADPQTVWHPPPQSCRSRTPGLGATERSSVPDRPKRPPDSASGERAYIGALEPQERLGLVEQASA